MARMIELSQIPVIRFCVEMARGIELSQIPMIRLCVEMTRGIEFSDSNNWILRGND